MDVQIPPWKKSFIFIIKKTEMKEQYSFSYLKERIKTLYISSTAEQWQEPT